MIDLPKGWLITTLGEVVDYAETHQVSPKAIPPGAWLLELEDIERDSSELLNRRTAREVSPKSSKNKFNSGDILYGKLRPYLNKVIIATEDGFCSSEIIPIAPGLLDRNYLFYFLKSPDFRDYVNRVSHGMRMPRLGTLQAKAAPFILPPRLEQTRIAKKIDHLFTQINAIEKRIDAVPALLTRLHQSILNTAMCGLLTKEWRTNDTGMLTKTVSDLKTISPVIFESGDNHPLPAGWAWTLLTDIAKLESGHTPRKSVPSYWNNGDIPWISLQDIRAADGQVIFQTKQMPTQLGIDKSSARVLPTGTVCLARDISVGYVTIMGKPMATSQHFANWVCDKNLLPEYLMLALKAIRNNLTMSGQGTTVKTIYMPALKQLKIALPPIEEQKEIIRRTTELFICANSLETNLKLAKERILSLRHSILTKAFSGKLVPQLLEEESSQILLANITKQRSMVEKPKKIATEKATGERMSSVKIKTIIEVLNEAGKPLTSQQILSEAGYPNDVNSEQLEQFFLDIREQLLSNKITKFRTSDSYEDIFSLSNLKEKSI